MIDEQLAHLVDDAEEASLRALVADNPAAAIEQRAGSWAIRRRWPITVVTSSPRSILSRPVRTNCSMNFAYSDACLIG